MEPEKPMHIRLVHPHAIEVMRLTAAAATTTSTTTTTTAAITAVAAAATVTGHLGESRIDLLFSFGKYIHEIPSLLRV